MLTNILLVILILVGLYACYLMHAISKTIVTNQVRIGKVLAALSSDNRDLLVVISKNLRKFNDFNPDKE